MNVVYAVLIFIALALGGCALLERRTARRARNSALPRTPAERWARIATGGSVHWK